MNTATQPRHRESAAANNRIIADSDWRDFAQALEIDEATLRAVAEVESTGSGFLPSPSRKPKVLFEGHAFHRLTGGRYSGEHPDISYPKWSRRKYSGSLAGEWRRLEAACQLDRACREQQVNEGHFPNLDAVPPYAFTLTIPALCSAAKMLCIAPEKRKAKAVADALRGPVSTACPASFLRTQPHATLFLDPDSASLL